MSLLFTTAFNLTNHIFMDIEFRLIMLPNESISLKQYVGKYVMFMGVPYFSGFRLLMLPNEIFGLN